MHYDGNNDNTLSSITFTGAPIGDLTYGWDDNKNKTSEDITGTMSDYGFNVGTAGYDDEDRLVAWNRADSNLDQSWDLSLVGGLEQHHRKRHSKAAHTALPTNYSPSPTKP